MSSGQQPAAPQDILHVNSPILRAFPWYSGVVLKLPNFFGKIGDNNLVTTSNYYQITACTRVWYWARYQ